MSCENRSIPREQRNSDYRNRLSARLRFLITGGQIQISIRAHFRGVLEHTIKRSAAKLGGLADLRSGSSDDGVFIAGNATIRFPEQPIKQVHTRRTGARTIYYWLEPR